MKTVYKCFREDIPYLVTESIEIAKHITGQPHHSFRSALYINRKDNKEFLSSISKQEDSFDKKKKLLRSWYKKYKVGMVKWEDIPSDTQALLKKYYGVFAQGGN